MNRNENKSGRVFLGFDVSEKSIEVFGVCGDKTTEQTIKIENSRAGIQALLAPLKPASIVTVVLETGTHSAWMSRFIRALGFEVIVAHARELALIYGANKKNDRVDAEKLARLAQADKKLLHPIEHMSEERQMDLMVVKCRFLLVRQRTQIINSVRGLLRAAGLNDHSISTKNMKNITLSGLPEPVIVALFPLIQQIRFIESQIKTYDREISRLCRKYQMTDVLRQIRGVGPAISLTFVLLSGDLKRFHDPKRLAAYFGLVPKQDQSGESDKQTSITKSGNGLMRVLLIQGAQYILGPFGEDCDLRDYGKRIEARGGAIARRKARVAVARKLIVLMYKLWLNPEVPYSPHNKKQNRQTHLNSRRKLYPREEAQEGIENLIAIPAR